MPGAPPSGPTCCSFPAPEDRDIWTYFASVSMPREEQAEAVLRALAEAGRPLSTAALETAVDVRRTRLELLLKVLDVDGAVQRVSGGWVVHRGAVDLRRRALRPGRRGPPGRAAAHGRLRARPTPAGWRSSRSASTTRPPSPCGRCDGCAGPLVPDRGARPRRRCRPRAAGPGRASTSTRGCSGPPAWTVSACRSRARSPPDEALLPGRALARLSDLGWGQRLREVLREDAPGPPRPAAGLRARARRVGLGPAAGRRRGGAVALPTRRWSARSPRGCPRSGGCRCSGRSTSPTAGPPASRAATARSGSPGCGSGSSSGPSSPLPSAGVDGPVLLVDDLVSSRWTLTVAGRALRLAGAAGVLPFALAVDG